MAKITKMPSMAVIDGFKGKLDFYVHMGQFCVRSWPRSPGHDRAPAVEEQWPAFAWAAKNWNNLSLIVKQAYNDLAVGTNLTGRDMFTKTFINGAYFYLDDI